MKPPRPSIRPRGKDVACLVCRECGSVVEPLHSHGCRAGYRWERPSPSIRPRGVGPRPGTPKSVRTEGARLLKKLRAAPKKRGYIENVILVPDFELRPIGAETLVQFAKRVARKAYKRK